MILCVQSICSRSYSGMQGRRRSPCRRPNFGMRRACDLEVGLGLLLTCGSRADGAHSNSIPTSNVGNHMDADQSSVLISITGTRVQNRALEGSNRLVVRKKPSDSCWSISRDRATRRRLKGKPVQPLRRSHPEVELVDPRRSVLRRSAFKESPTELCVGLEIRLVRANFATCESCRVFGG